MLDSNLLFHNCGNTLYILFSQIANDIKLHVCRLDLFLYLVK